MKNLKAAFLLMSIFLLPTCGDDTDLINLEQFRQQGSAHSNLDQDLVNFQQMFNLVFIDVEIAGRIYKFLFDTGFSFTTISKELAHELDPSIVGMVHATDIHGNEDQVELAFLDRFSIGQTEFVDNGVGIIDLNSVLELECLGFDGIIGGNSIAKMKWQFDFEQDEVLISDDIERFPKDPSTVVLPVYLENWTPTTSIELEGRPIDDVLLDFGATDGFIFNFGVFNQFSNSKETIKSYGFAGSGAFGSRTDSIFYGIFEDMVIGDQIRQPSLLGFSIQGNNNKNLIIGMEFIQNFGLTLDYDNHEVWLTPKERQSIPVSLSSYGFRFWYNDRRLEVSTIFENSPAGRTGLELGDVILEIDGRPTSNLTRSEFCQLNSEGVLDGNRSLRILIQRNGEVWEVNLEKELLIG